MYETTFPKTPSLASIAQDQYGPQYLKPFHTAQLVEPRIDAAKPSLWTNVSTDGELMRTILRAYNLNELEFCTCFHKDYFLDGMISRNRRFCSPLLVNAVLAWRCVSIQRPYSPLLLIILISTALEIS